MRFTVTWHPAAEAELAEICLRASDRADVSNAANAIDLALAAKPLDEGEEFNSDRIRVSPRLGANHSIIAISCGCRKMAMTSGYLQSSVTYVHNLFATQLFR